MPHVHEVPNLRVNDRVNDHHQFLANRARYRYKRVTPATNTCHLQVAVLLKCATNLGAIASPLFGKCYMGTGAARDAILASPCTRRRAW